jgi:hypothetical protein
MMNEKIKEIGEKAGGIWAPDYDDFLFATVDLERFAELIVSECMNNLSWHGHDEAVSQLEWFKANKLGIKS